MLHSLLLVLTVSGTRTHEGPGALDAVEAEGASDEPSDVYAEGPGQILPDEASAPLAEPLESALPRLPETNAKLETLAGD